MTNEINILRFLTSVRNDPFPYYDTVSLREGEGGGVIFILLCVGHRHENFMLIQDEKLSRILFS